MTIKPNEKAALEALDKALALLRSVQTLDGTDKDSVEHLLEVALESLRTPITETIFPSLPVHARDSRNLSRKWRIKSAHLREGDFTLVMRRP